jgi:adenylosuccinate synthase
VSLVTIADRTAYVVVDLGFGDAGKGAAVDFLVRDRGAGLVVRFHGGAQAGHRVVLRDGRSHVFSQVGAGTFVPGVRTHLADGFVLHPLALKVELAHLAAAGVHDVLSRLTIDERALVITPFHQAMGRLVELARGKHRHGTVGIGFGDAVRDALEGSSDVIRARALRDEDLVRRLASVQERKRAAARALALEGLAAALPELALLEDVEAPTRIADAWRDFARSLSIVDGDRLGALLEESPAVVLEGAQGVLLDETWGFHPHTTWSDCTFGRAHRALAEHDFSGAVHRLGVVRSYATRHGAGPFPSEDYAYGARLVDAANDGHSLQGAFRQGPLDLVLLRYALEVTRGADALVVNCLDRLAALPAVEIVARYRLDEESALVRRDPSGLVAALEPGAPDDLGHRERLTALLARVRPVRERVNAGELLARIETELRVPVALAGYGETADDRRWVRALPSRSAE